MLWEVSSDKPCLRNLHVGMLAHFGTASQMVSIHPNGFSTNLWDTVGERIVFLENQRMCPQNLVAPTRAFLKLHYCFQCNFEAGEGGTFYVMEADTQVNSIS
ncbi:hypothetical protein P8452_14718 [Trifolium repens]|nr:hypothetical protein P8452_14718 [Trifolium repens]